MAATLVVAHLMREREVAERAVPHSDAEPVLGCIVPGDPGDAAVAEVLCGDEGHEVSANLISLRVHRVEESI